MARKVICQYCKSQTDKIDKDLAERVDEKNFHPNCAILYRDRKQLYETICRIFKLKAPGPRNIAYITKFFNQGMTYKGMNFTLVYFYDIKKNSISKAGESIGIIPYVYEEASKYFNNKKNMKEKEKEQIEKINEINKKEKVVRYVKAQKREKIGYSFHKTNEFEW